MSNYRTPTALVLRSRGALRPFRRSGAAALLLIAFAGTAHADKVDDYIKAQMVWQRIPGLSLAVVKEGKIIKAKGYGRANVETDTPATPETRYKIGSVSKQFLAAGMMVLVQEGKISLNDSLSNYLEGAPDAWKNITVRHLLTHTSGLIREPPGFDPYKMQSDAEVIKSVYAEPLRFAPGEKWEYSNTGYYCLAEIIHKVSGKPWSEFIAERIFAPAGMAETRTTTAEIVPHRASGYETRGGKLLNAENWLALRPSGAFLSTVLDFAKWDSALSADTPLTALSRAQMGTPVPLNNGATAPYGFGWFVDTVQGHKRLSHSGGVPGFVCNFQRYTEDKLTIIVMVNVGGRDLGDLAIKVASFYLPALAPPPPTLSPDPEPEVTAQIKKTIAALAQGKIDANLFTPQMSANLAEDNKSGFNAILSQMGPIQSIALIARRKDGDNRIYQYQLGYRNITLFVGCTFTPENKISRLSIQD